MKPIKTLANVFDKLADKVDEKTIKGLVKSANKVKDDVVELAPGGEYKSSIKVSPVEKDGDFFSVKVYTDMIVGRTKWGPTKPNKFENGGIHAGASHNAPAGTFYNLGYLLEHGTFEHAIPNAWGKGNYYGYTDENEVWHKGTLDPNWHPGTKAQPHFSLAFEKNKKLIKKYIVEELRK